MRRRLLLTGHFRQIDIRRGPRKDRSIRKLISLPPGGGDTQERTFIFIDFAVGPNMSPKTMWSHLGPELGGITVHTAALSSAPTAAQASGRSGPTYRSVKSNRWPSKQRDASFSYVSRVSCDAYALREKFRDQWRCHLISKGKPTHIRSQQQQYRSGGWCTEKKTER